MLITGLILIFVAGFFQGTWALGIKKSDPLRWESLWAPFSLIGMFLIPVIWTWIVIPDFTDIYRSVPGHVLLKPLFFGSLWGIGAITFGLAIRYIGISLSYGINMGVASAVGSLIPFFLIDDLLVKLILIVVAGTFVMIIGVVLITIAGILREKLQDTGNKQNVKTGNTRKGILFALIGGFATADLNQLFIQLKIDKAIIFGMSSGGRLAIDFTLTYPEKVNGLVLVGAVVSGFGYTSHMDTRGGHFDPKKITDPVKVNEYFIKDDPYEIYSENTVAKEKVMKLLPNLARQNMVPTQPAGKVAVRSLSEIKVPALILVGEYDIPDVHAHAGVINAGIGNSKREIIPRSGHLIPIEQPALFNEAIMNFLNKFPK